jgi:hypothetical protein
VQLAAVSEIRNPYIFLRIRTLADEPIGCQFPLDLGWSDAPKNRQRTSKPFEIVDDLFLSGTEACIRIIQNPLE